MFLFCGWAIKASCPLWRGNGGRQGSTYSAQSSLTYFSSASFSLNMARLGGILFLLLAVVSAFFFLHQNREELRVENDSEKCLRDADCRGRLEAAVNEVYSESGYDGVYSTK